MGGFRDDPDWPLVAALEVFDDETQQARPAAIFTQRVIAPPLARLGVDSAPEAVAVCLDESGSLDLDRIAELLGTDEDGGQSRVGAWSGTNRDRASWSRPAGTCRATCGRSWPTAQAAAADDPRWEANVAALAAVLPRQLEPGEITAGLGAPWIPPSDVEAFCAEVLGASVEVERAGGPGPLDRGATSRPAGVGQPVLGVGHGPGRRRHPARCGLNQRLHTVTDQTDDGRRVRNDAETLAARDKQEALGARFAAWVWEDPAGPSRLAERYNELFNSVVLPVPRRQPPQPARAWPPASAPIPTSATPSPASSPTAARCSPTPSAPARPPPWSWPPWSCAASAWRPSRPSWSPTTCSSSSPGSGSSSTRRPRC